MIDRVPILGGYDQLKLPKQPICHGYHFIAGWNSKGPTREEIVLKVNEDHCVHWVR